MSLRRPRESIERREEVFKRIDRGARTLVDSDLQATRKKTAKLKAQRLAKEAAEKKR